MAITTLDGIIAGMRPPEQILKSGGTMEAAGQWHTFWYTGGVPGAAAANSAGVNGRAVSPADVLGEIYRANPGAGNAYLARLAANAPLPGTLMLVDRLWENSGLSTTLTTAQAITPATLPARDADGSTNGRGVLGMVEWSAAGGAGTPLVTLTYTDSDGGTGHTGTIPVANATPAAGTCEIFGLQGGDKGIRAPTSFIQNATRTSGTMHLVLFRPIAFVSVPAAYIGQAVDAVSGGMPRIYNDSVLQLLWMPSATTAINLQAQYIETQG